MALQKLMAGIAGIVFRPVAGLVQHQTLHRGAQGGAVWDQVGRDEVKAVKRLAQGKGQAGADLEDGKAIADKGASASVV